jgi:hypothetical protein
MEELRQVHAKCQDIRFDDPLAAARGIILGVACGALIWLALGTILVCW